MRTKLVLSVCLLLSAGAFAQATKPRRKSIVARLNANLRKAEAACGDPNIKFQVYQDQDPTVNSIPPNQARVVIVEQSNALYGSTSDNFTSPYWGSQPGDPLQGITLRVGLDGKWVGAIRYDSYISFFVTPGIHHLCVQQQSLSKVLTNNVTVAKLSAVAGESYNYIADNFGQFPLRIADPDKFKLLVFKTKPVPAYSTPLVYKKRKRRTKS